jgi:putative ABC transport system permease protein
MTKATVKGLLGRKLRTALTALAIVLGVAMITGAFVTTDTMLKASDDLKKASYGSADAVVSGRQAFKLSDNGNGGTQRKPVSEALIPKVRSAPDVAYVSGEVSGEAKLTDRNGKVLTNQSGPPFAVGFNTEDPGARALSPFKIKQGAYPTQPGEVAIDLASAKKQHYNVGDTVGIVADGPVRQYKITGMVSFGGVDSIGSASAAVFSLAGAQQLLHRPAQVDSILVKGKPGVPAAQVRQSIGSVLPPTAQVQSAQSQDRFDLSGLDQFLKILRTALLVFGFISLFVGAFIIFNTLSITVAQRTKEFGLLRMIGASRRQILRSVVLEAVVIGFLASLMGIAAGFGLSKAIDALFRASDIDLPSAGTVFALRTVIVAIAVGVGVTTVAGLAPALRATRIAPVAALREGSMDAARKRGKVGWTVTGILLALGIGLICFGVFAPSQDATTVLVSMGAGSLLMFIGVALVAPWIARPMASFIGRASARLGGASGKLARDNAMRNPHRTATTAAALMIGIALVAFVAVLGAGIRNSFDDALKKQVAANYIVTSPDGFAPFSNGAIVTKKYADKHDLHVGSTFGAITATGSHLSLVVRGVQDRPSLSGNPLGLGNVLIARQLFDKTFTDAKLRYAFVNGNVPESTVKSALAQFPDAKTWTLAAYQKDQDKQFDQFLSVLYVLLALSVIVSLFGIVNTLVLSVFERTRELGMLRAVGMTRRQVRRMIRHESIITALIGGVLGIVIGTFLSALVTQALSGEGVSFSLPVGSLIAFLLVAMVAGVIAAIGPARRASRLNVLNALQYE